MAYTVKPKRAPAFDAGTFVALISDGKPIPAKLQTQYLNWKRWVESSSQYAGATSGGIRDVLNADMLAVDQLKAGQDAQAQQLLDLQADVKALQEAPPARPFP